MIKRAQRRFAPTVIGITRNSDRHQIGMSDRHRRNTHDTLLFQIYGRKQVVLFGPDQGKHLYEEGPDGLRGRFDRAALRLRLPHSDLAVLRDKVKWSRVDPFYPDKPRYPVGHELECVEGVIGPGDTLYIPNQWWHGVRALEPTISVSIGPSLDELSFARFADGR